MGVIPERTDFKNCPKELFTAFTAVVTERGLCRRVSFTPAGDKSQFDTMGLEHDNRRVTFVYDNRAHILSVTAHDDVMPALTALYASLSGSQAPQPPAQNAGKQQQAQDRQGNKPSPQNRNKAVQNDQRQNNRQNKQNNNQPQQPKQQQTNPQQPTSQDPQKQQPRSAQDPQKQQPKNNPQPTQKQQRQAQKQQKNTQQPQPAGSRKNNENADKGSEKSTSPARNAPQKPTDDRPKTASQAAEKPADKKATAAEKPADKRKPADDKQKSDGKRKAVTAAAQDADESGGFSIKKFTPERFDALLARIRAEKKTYKLADEGTLDKGKATELKCYLVTGHGQKLKLRFMPGKRVLSLQGKRENLFDELKLLAAEETDYSAAVDAHIELTGESRKRSAALERQLKKLLPTAFDYLSKESKTEFTIGVMEIINSSARHYDYSMLLLAPFRGLERLIFDLQRARGVEVKMIGQAYEKQDGEYVLKASYRKRIGSVVYAEAMAALYRLYSSERNYYAHTDNTSAGEARRIVDRAQVNAVFEKILTTVEYNCKKLSEIGFTI